MSNTNTLPVAEDRTPMKRSNSVPRRSAIEPLPHEELQDVIAQVQETMAPVWPLQDYVAINPYAAFVDRSLPEARRRLRAYSDCDLLMPLAYYAQQFQSGQLSLEDIAAAASDLRGQGELDGHESVDAIAARLRSFASEASGEASSEADLNRERCIQSFAELLDQRSGTVWTETLRELIGKFCGAHYDEGQAAWTSPWRDLPLFQAWRSAAVHDLTPETLGLPGFRRFVADLPETPYAAIQYCLRRLGVPAAATETFLLSQAFSIIGWSAWTKHQSAMAEEGSSRSLDFAGLLAARLAYDAALSAAFSVDQDWSAAGRATNHGTSDDEGLRYLLLRASELRYQRELLEQLSASDAAASAESTDPGSPTTARALAQMAFCIDVRSERIRRRIETVNDSVETMGFAGFFGLPVEYVRMGETTGTRQTPVLLSPRFQLHEGLRSGAASPTPQVLRARTARRFIRKAWKAFRSSAAGCFTFVETMGLMYGLRLLRNTIVGDCSSKGDFDGVAPRDRERLGPTLCGLNQQGVTTSQQADMAESILRGLGLTRDFARLVVFCGHASQCENNPLQAGLDCGACGGHSGEPNARFAATLLNQPYIRQALADRGVDIPDDVHFLAAVHNTTTDAIEFFDLYETPATHVAEVLQLTRSLDAAAELTRTERMPLMACDNARDLWRRSRDWSEVRPEWGLAGNAAFIAAPRSLTKHVDLQGRVFMHNYDFRLDEGASVLEQIMTAPLVVAHLINMQYYASTVDHQHFGSGTKTVHNVVGQFGVFSGNGGDLKTGLPWESIHNGTSFHHSPLRLFAVIAAPRQSISAVIEKHASLQQMLHNGWLHLVSLDEGVFHRYDRSGAWLPTELAAEPSGLTSAALASLSVS